MGVVREVPVPTMAPGSAVRGVRFLETRGRRAGRGLRGAQQSQRGLVKVAIGGEHGIRVDRRAPVQIRENATGFLDQDLARSEIPWFEASALAVYLRIDLGLALGHQGVTHVVTEPALT